MRLKVAMNKKAKAPSKAGRKPFAASLPMLVSNPIAASATDNRNVVAAMIHALAPAGIVTKLLTPTSATKPSTNHGTGGRADDAPADLPPFAPPAASHQIGRAHV